MNRNELIDLFQTHLNRYPRESEISMHLPKSYSAFEAEILGCEEYIRLHGPSEIQQKKIAILLSGHIRRNSVLPGISNALHGYDIDLFIHTWDNLGLKGTEMNLYETAELEKQRVISEINKLPNVRAFKIENNKEYIESIKDEDSDITYFNMSSPEPFLKSQLYSIHQSWKMFEQYQKETGQEYGLVVKLRFDLDIVEFRPSNRIFIDCNQHNIIFMPNKDNAHFHSDYGTSCWACDKMYHEKLLTDVHIFDHTNIVCDVMAYGSVKSMKEYCNLHKNYRKIYKAVEKENFRMLKLRKEKNIQSKGKDYIIKHNDDGLYYFYGSYPERALSLHLKNFMLPESKTIKCRLVR